MQLRLRAGAGATSWAGSSDGRSLRRPSAISMQTVQSVYTRYAHYIQSGGECQAIAMIFFEPRAFLFAFPFHVWMAYAVHYAFCGLCFTWSGATFSLELRFVRRGLHSRLRVAPCPVDGSLSSPSRTLPRYGIHRCASFGYGKDSAWKTHERRMWHRTLHFVRLWQKIGWEKTRATDMAPGFALHSVMAASSIWLEACELVFSESCES